MTTRAFENAMCEISEKYIVEAINYSKAASSFRPKRRLSIIPVAAIMMLFLLGAGVVAVVYGNSIQSWFGHLWEEITGQEMSDEHAALIDHLSQEIGASQTVGQVTVTVDSATVGDDCFFVLLRVKGLDLTTRYNYGFDEVRLDVSPDPVLQDGGLGRYGFQYNGCDGDGAALFMLDHAYVSVQGVVWDDRPLEVNLTLQNFHCSPAGDDDRLLQEGEWSFKVVLDRSEPPHRIALPDTAVSLFDRKNRKDVEVLLTNMELTNTGLRFRYNADGRTYTISPDIIATLNDGTEIFIMDGTGAPLEDGETMSYSYKWMVPIDLDEVVSIRIENVEIPVPK